MDVLTNLNLCKLFFASVTFPVLVMGLLMNTPVCEARLPFALRRIFRYGKFGCREESKFFQSVELPKSYFRHFYVAATFVCCPLVLHQLVTVYIFNDTPGVLVRLLLDFTCGFNRTGTVSATHTFIATILMSLQVLRRFYDTHFVSVFSKKAKMNLSHYLIGLLHYFATFALILSEAPKFADGTTANGTLRMREIGLKDMFAVVLFLWAWYHQHLTSVILANVRKNEKGVVVSQDYKVPEGDWFDYLSSPHSVAEIVMYSAITILLSNNSGWWYVFVWVVANQTQTILYSHRWYKKSFKDFPSNRKALIPGVF